MPFYAKIWGSVKKVCTAQKKLTFLNYQLDWAIDLIISSRNGREELMNLAARRNVVKKFGTFFCATHLLKNHTASNTAFGDIKVGW